MVKSSAAGWLIYTLAQAFAHCNMPKGYSVIRVHGSAPSFAVNKISSAPAVRRPGVCTTDASTGYGIYRAPIIAFIPTWGRYRTSHSIADSSLHRAQNFLPHFSYESRSALRVSGATFSDCQIS